MIESIGFSATHAISDMLRQPEENYVSHGTRNFKQQTKVGTADLSISEFLTQMQDKHNEFENCISVHSLFNPTEIAQETSHTEVEFYGVARKSQKKQILSCFYWAVNGFLNGQQDLTNSLSRIHIKYASLLNKIGLQSNLTSNFMLYAYRHVARYNCLLAENAQKIFFMEDIISDPVCFYKKLGIHKKNGIHLEMHQGISHKKSVENYSFISECEAALERIASLNFHMDGKVLKLEEIEKQLHQKCY